MYLGVANARTIQEGQKIQERQPREELPVYLSDKLGLVDARHVHMGVVEDGHIFITAFFHLLGVLQHFGLRGGHLAGEMGEERGKRA